MAPVRSSTILAIEGVSMSVNLYLKNDIREATGFTEKPYKDNSTGMDRRIDGVSIFGLEGNFHVSHSENDPIPPKLAEYVVRITLHDFISTERARRETGVYRDGDTVAEVTVANSNRPMCHVKLEGNDLDKIKGLLRKIQAGSIRPVESYEGQQSGLSRKQLEMDLESNKGLLKEAQSSLQLALSRVSAAYKLSAELEAEGWPWTTKSSMAARINNALNDGPNN